MNSSHIIGLEQHPILAGYSGEHADEVCKAAVEQIFRQGDCVYPKDSPSDGFYLVMEGSVSLCREIRGELSEVDRRSDGDIFGEVSMLTGDNHSYHAVAATDCRLAMVPADTFRTCMKDVPVPMKRMLRKMVEHVSVTSAVAAKTAMQQEKLALVGGMVNHIVHDMKSPFQSINLGAQTIDVLIQDRRVHNICSTITGQVARMLRMATELSEFSRGNYQMNFEEIALAGFVRLLREDNVELLERYQATFICEVPDICVEMEQRGMSRVFQNLITNSLEAKKKGCRIELRAESDEKNNIVKFLFSDNGPGIDKSIRGTLWEPFVTHGKKCGVGLGTSIVKNIVTAHGGEIAFHTGTGTGTTFEITIPLRHDQPETHPEFFK